MKRSVLFILWIAVLCLVLQSSPTIALADEPLPWSDGIVLPTTSASVQAGIPRFVIDEHAPPTDVNIETNTYIASAGQNPSAQVKATVVQSSSHVWYVNVIDQHVIDNLAETNADANGYYKLEWDPWSTISNIDYARLDLAITLDE